MTEAIHKKATDKLARLLAVVVMFAGGQLEIPFQVFDSLPKGLKLVEHYDDEKDAIVLRVGIPPAAAAEPQLEDVPPVDVTGEPIVSE